MTIYLPNTIPAFRQAFDETVERIPNSQYDETFWALFAQLVTTLHENVLIKPTILQVEAEHIKQKQEFNIAALEAIGIIGRSFGNPIVSILNIEGS